MREGDELKRRAEELQRIADCASRMEIAGSCWPFEARQTLSLRETIKYVKRVSPDIDSSDVIHTFADVEVFKMIGVMHKVFASVPVRCTLECGDISPPNLNAGESADCALGFSPQLNASDAIEWSRKRFTELSAHRIVELTRELFPELNANQTIGLIRKVFPELAANQITDSAR
jgi:hypothetical protein